MSPKLVAKKNDWINEGILLFSKMGYEGIVVEKMAKNLGCNKSSFYWHFKTKEAFLDEIINWWIQMATEEFIALAEKKATAKDKFIELATTIFTSRGPNDFMFFLQKLTEHNKKVASIVQQIEDRRIRYVQILLTGMDYSEDTALTKSKVFYKYLTGWHMLNQHKETTPQMLDEVFKEISQFITLK